MTEKYQRYAKTQLESIQQRIKDACTQVDRDPNSIKLIGASKRQTPELIAKFAKHGLQHVGENYLQEAITKKQTLDELALTWHFIGQIQSNKTRTIATNFTWVHGVDRLKIAQRLSNQSTNTSPINLLIQLNPDHEDSKGGVSLAEAGSLCDQIAQLDNIKLRGFMMIPKARESRDEQERVFAQAQQLLSQTNQHYGISMDTLSMGMSDDLEAAIAQGSTMVRIGTALFGARD